MSDKFFDLTFERQGGVPQDYSSTGQGSLQEDLKASEAEEVINQSPS